MLFRRAKGADLGAIIALLADDPWGAKREDASLPLDPGYLDAFTEIDNDPNQLLAVAEEHGRVVGCVQISFIRTLSHRGELCGQIEGVRVASSRRGARIGEQMILWAVEECRDRGCRAVQLMSTKARVDAQRLYARLGFAGSHEGMKLAF